MIKKHSHYFSKVLLFKIKSKQSYVIRNVMLRRNWMPAQKIKS